MVTNLVTTAVFALGLASVAYGSWLISESLGFIVGGLALAALPVLYVRGGDG